MKNVLLLLCVSFCLSSCSYLSNFYIYNNSDEKMEIIYKTKRTELNKPFVTKPVLYSFDGYENIKEKVFFQADVIKRDSLTVEIRLKPKTAAWIGTYSNFSLKNDGDVLTENLEYMQIVHRRDTIIYTPENIPELFKTYTSEIIGLGIE